MLKKNTENKTANATPFIHVFSLQTIALIKIMLFSLITYFSFLNRIALIVLKIL